MRATKLHVWCLLPLFLASIAFADSDSTSSASFAGLKTFGTAGKELHVLADGK